MSLIPFADLPIEGLLSKAYAKARRQEISRDHAGAYKAGSPLPFGNTVYVTCVDRERNVVSLINSVFSAFGSGVVAGDTGICLQNRGPALWLIRSIPMPWHQASVRCIRSSQR